jgi:hypothetical protein
MGAWLLELHSDLEEAVQVGLLSMTEAWEVMDERLVNPQDPYPFEMGPLLRKLRMLDWPIEDMTRQ